MTTQKIDDQNPEITHTTVNFANANAHIQFVAVLIDQLQLPFSCFCQYNRGEV
jgi:hypothetical protein